MKIDFNYFDIFDEIAQGGESIDSLQEKYWVKNRQVFLCGIELTTFCNLRCVHCYLNGEHRERYVLNADDFKLILDKLYNVGVLALYFTGGEIFTYPYFEEVYVYAKKKGFIITLLSNGTLINEKIIDILNEYPPFWMSLSMYGTSCETYKKITGNADAYNQFVRGLKLLLDNGIKTEVKFIGLKDNIADYEEARVFVEGLNIQFRYTMEMFPAFSGCYDVAQYALNEDEIIEMENTHPEMYHEWDFTNLDNPYSKLKVEDYLLYPCNCASTVCFVDHRGYLNPCVKMRLEEYNLLDCSFDEAWTDFKRFQELKAPADFKCAKCKYYRVCSPCPVINELATGSAAVPPKYVCSIIEKRAKAYSKKKSLQDK